MRKPTLVLTALAIALLALTSLAKPQAAAALSGADFQPGRIIDDQVFYNPNAMTVQQIQDFLDFLVPTCDTNGDQPYYGTYGGVTYNGNILRKNLDPNYPPPYTCLRDYYENTTTHANNIGDPTNIPAGAISAAQIIYNSAQEFNINPEVLITLIEKESLGPLTTDDWPWPNEYQTVAGYACPDGASCDTSYYGFYNQIYNAARQFNLYTQNPNSYNYTVGMNNIKYNPNAACGTEAVNIVNQATANLYNYTPYVPDQAALNNLYGLGDSCSSYGNRNFWRIFNDWFGSTFGGDLVSDAVEITGPITLSPSAPIPGQVVTATYTVQNVSSAAVTFQASVLQCRIYETTNCDPAWGGAQTLNPGDQYTFTTSIAPVKAGAYTLTPYFETNNTWYRYSSVIAGGDSVSVSVPAYVAPMSLVGPITSSPAQPIPGQTATISYTVKNNGTLPAIFENSLLQCRFNTNTNCDPAWNAPITIAAGQQQTLTNTFVVRAGTYVFTPYYQQNDTWYTYAGDSTAMTGNVLTVSVPAYVANVGLVGPVSISPAAPIPGQDVTVSYTVQNNGTLPAIFENSVLQCRENSATVCDPSWNAPVTINPGNSQTFSNTFSRLQAGNYTFIPYFEQNETWYKYNPGTGGNSASISIPPYVASLQIQGNVTVSPSAPTVGQTVTVSYTVQNIGSQPAILQNAITQCRLNTTTVCDPAWTPFMTINAGAQHTFSDTFTLSSAGTYMFVPYFEQNNTWYRYGSTAANGNYLVVSAH